MITRLWMFFPVVIMVSCGSGDSDKVKLVPDQEPVVETDPLLEEVEEEEELGEIFAIDYDTTLWTDISFIQEDVILDLRYATKNNFLGEVLYDCPRCLLRPEVALALQRVHWDLQEKGMSIKVFDCYRPQFVQKKMWEIKPNPNYVANPQHGSMHTRGVAVDVTIVNSEGKEINMGTDFDHFGIESHVDYLEHSDEVLDNRALLRETMENYGLKGIQTEWWHFSMRGLNYPLDTMRWNCN
nr:M15 family metallopeptidase [Saprospiraceae bacterium]